MWDQPGIQSRFWAGLQYESISKKKRNKGKVDILGFPVAVIKFTQKKQVKRERIWDTTIAYTPEHSSSRWEVKAAGAWRSVHNTSAIRKQKEMNACCYSIPCFHLHDPGFQPENGTTHRVGGHPPMSNNINPQAWSEAHLLGELIQLPMLISYHGWDLLLASEIINTKATWYTTKPSKWLTLKDYYC